MVEFINIPAEFARAHCGHEFWAEGTQEWVPIEVGAQVIGVRFNKLPVRIRLRHLPEGSRVAASKCSVCGGLFPTAQMYPVGQSGAQCPRCFCTPRNLRVCFSFEDDENKV